jgi:spore coat polysaccharide biosynthesis predicted glycosyltransferase SpsG
MTMKLCIICRGSGKLGLGHLFRTRTFARFAREDHQVKVIAVIEPGLETIFDEIADDTVIVYNEKDVPEHVTAFQPDFIVFDLTDIERSVFDLLKTLPAKRVSISPVFSRIDELDIMFLRTEIFSEVPGLTIYGDLKYSIFNDYCIRIDDDSYFRNLSLPETPIAICMGGGDAANKSLAVLNSLVNIESSCVFWVLLGEGYQHSYNDFVNVANSNRKHEIILAKTSRSMWRILSNCTLAVLAGGLTTIEAVYAGLPTINIFEKEQHLAATSKELIDAGVCLNGGLFNNDSLNKLFATVETLVSKKSKLLEMREKSFGMVDKRGAQRILEKLEFHFSTK